MLSIRAHFGTVAVGMPVTRTPRTDPGVRYSRTGLLSGTRFRDSGFGMLLFPPWRLARIAPARLCPVRVSFEGCVPLSTPSP